ncbi:MAG: HupE/UreJ family protein [Deltaproteobacteria bacterium]|nr:HupE/UreJ family protein [Deltaproteobacteria bacterium]
MTGTFWPKRSSSLLRRRVVLACAAVPLLALAPSATSAHNLAPAYLELRELAGGEVAVLWKQSAVIPRGVRLEPRLPCPDASEPAARLDAEAVVLEWRIACGGELVGRSLSVDGLAGSGVDTVVRVALADGREVRAILSEAAPALAVPARESSARVFASYLRLGAEHLASGLDHVLFVAGLALLLGATRRLVVAITAFTLGHSATLALAALGVVAPPQSLVEVAIAATIVALALALARAPADEQRAVGPRGIARHPALLPFAFGLLHGLGFAGALAELGLPQHAIPLALLAFNVGIELGQLGIVALLLGALWLLRRAVSARATSPGLPRFARELPASAIGALGVFWCLDRAAALLFP